jgi:hypothetical protein
VCDSGELRLPDLPAGEGFAHSAAPAPTHAAPAPRRDRRGLVGLAREARIVADRREILVGPGPLTHARVKLDRLGEMS